MVKQIFDERPESIQDLGTGYFNIHFNIEEVTEQQVDEDTGEPEDVTRYSANVERVSSLEYGDIVCKLIRKRYTESQELALLRQRDMKSVEFDDYYSYCEDCKEVARVVLNMV